ncbi:hypothetical protein BDC45DRAFT_128854 [Circinella umbellata]|nr:hypothetical protein BDC45DRAFT_128854 [Circinella umbellata]
MSFNIQDPLHIRNVSIVGSDQHGKTTLMDHILHNNYSNNRNKIITTNYDYVMTTRSNPVTIRSKSIVSDDDNDLLLNIIDTPGHPEFLGQITGDLQLTDGIILVVDCTENLFEHVEAILKHALSSNAEENVGGKGQEKVPVYKKSVVLFINKVDILLNNITETSNDFETIYKTLKKTISDVNNILRVYQHPQLDPKNGNVLFGSALHGWVIDLNYFTSLYHRRFGIDRTKLRERLWDDHFYDSDEKKWRKTLVKGDVQRGFNKFILLPIHQSLQATSTLISTLFKKKKNNDSNKSTRGLNSDNYEDTDSMQKMNDIFKRFDVRIDPRTILEQLKQHCRPNDDNNSALFHLIMRHTMSVQPYLINIINSHLPSPIQAQQRNFQRFRKTKDIVDEAIHHCDPSGPLIIYFAKQIELKIPLIETAKNDYKNYHVVSLGRVFSGTLKINNSGDTKCTVRLSTQSLLTGTYTGNILKIISLEKKREFYNTTAANKSNNYNVSAGCLVAFLMKEVFRGPPATLTLKDEILNPYHPVILPEHPIRSSLPVIEVPILVEQEHNTIVHQALQKLVRIDPGVSYSEEESEKHSRGYFITVAGKRHLKVSIDSLAILCQKEQENELRKQQEGKENKDNKENTDFVAPVNFKVVEDDQIVVYQETITKTSPSISVKSPNKFTRITMHVQPTQEKQDNNTSVTYTSSRQNTDHTTDTITNHSNIEKREKQRLIRRWYRNKVDHNHLIEDTHAVLYIHELKGGIIECFKWVQKGGPLCYSPLGNCTFCIDDIFSNCDPIKRGNSQIILMTRRAMYGCLINADMTLQEPIYTVEIVCKASVAKTIREFLTIGNNNDDDSSNNDGQRGQRYRGYVFVNEIEQCHLLKTVRITFRLPVSETIGLEKELDKNPSTKVESIRMTLHHWEQLPGLAYDPNSEVHKLICKLRKRRGLPEVIPTYSDLMTQ